MTRVLFITANPKPVEQSISLSLGMHAIEHYKKRHPSHAVDTLDLAATSWPHLDSDRLRNYMNPQGECALEAQKFKSYDKYIVVAPMWNLTIPSTLKAYLDTIIIPNIMFSYNEQGRSEGLCGGKMIYIGARGGDYSQGPQANFAFDDQYMRGICHMIGIHDYQAYVVNGVGGYRRHSVSELLEMKKADIEAMVEAF
ncbi:FMN-dependent NADH-azoreductase [Photobacterium kagoshimensis]|uniref:FMN-dependent NADH-azoreductase n=1 Tax=Photobacterium kagoshimensis TaxID=2910242 RepID=UPI003D0AECA9